ncbi:D-alanine--D-alanine ligase [Paenibacillus turpanensis]|uniref:D-alanine--D-alanine ligase n=1 Tax=Paenibacillus turpanensis TaxID=2689078 RepID=UPI001408BC06|nr:D-alanine--D-alanine ligase [Paenibacillus turpanensis]
MHTKLRVALVYGGKSGEHDVSLQTAFAVMKAFDYGKYDISPIYITKEGRWRQGPMLTAPAERKELLTWAGEKDAAISSTLPAASQESSALLPLLANVGAASEDRAIDVVFPLLHGTNGEDGTIQGMLEMLQIPYVGAGVLASAVGMDKVIMKQVFAQAGIPQCLYRHFTRYEWEQSRDEYIMEIEISLGYPCFVKPANLGSSVGISKASNREELEKAVAYAFQYDRKVLVEEAVDGREIEVAVLGNDNPRASVAGEIKSSNHFYDYKAKYVDGKSEMVIPAEIPAEQAEEVRRLAIKAYKAIDGSGLSRVDFFLLNKENRFLINEVNTMPGFTPFSMYPLLWKETGVSYQELLDELIRLAVERYEEKQKIQYGFDVE